MEGFLEAKGGRSVPPLGVVSVHAQHYLILPHGSCRQVAGGDEERLFHPERGVLASLTRATRAHSGDA